MSALRDEFVKAMPTVESYYPGSDIENNISYVMLWDAENCNPNGDPDSDDYPRTIVSKGTGMTTSVFWKRRLRDRVSAIVAERDIPVEDGYDMYIKNEKTTTLYTRQAGILKKSQEWYAEHQDELNAKTNIIYWYSVCGYYDNRCFGAVHAGMSKKDSSEEEDKKEKDKGLDIPKELKSIAQEASAITGPVQVAVSESTDKIRRYSSRITRVCVEKESDILKKNAMGSKKFIDYGLYRTEIYLCKQQAFKTGFTKFDLGLFEDSMKTLFESSRSDSKQGLCVRAIYKFTHPSKETSIQGKELTELIDVKRKADIETAYSFKDYDVFFDEKEFKSNPLYEGVIFEKLK